MTSQQISGLIRCLLAVVMAVSFSMTACGGGNGTTTPPQSLSIATASLPDGTIGSYLLPDHPSHRGVAPFTWSVSTGALPHSLALASSTANSVTISGTPASRCLAE